MLTENDIRNIADRIVKTCAPLALGTFGSYAVGTAKAGSDLDLFVVRHTSEWPHARARSIRRSLFGILHPVDVHVFTPQEFETTVYEELSFTWVIAKQARLYHWSPEAIALLPSMASAVQTNSVVST